MTAFAISRTFTEWCGEIAASFSDAQQAFVQGAIQPKTFHAVAELSALQLHSRLETLLEELFVSCLIGVSGLEVDRLFEPVSRDQAMALLLRDPAKGNDYLPWLPITSTFERAAKYFRAGRPFIRLRYRPAIAEPLNELTIVRNAVAHPGQLAGRKFAELESSRGYHHGRPADFLLAVRDGSTELERYIAVAKVIGRVLAEPAEADLDTIAGAERTFNSKERGVPPGNYNCTHCGTAVALLTGGDLRTCPCSLAPAGPCPSCGQATPCTACSRPRELSSQYVRVPV